MKFKETYKPSTQPESSSGWQGFFPETELSVLSLNTLAEMADSGNEEAITAVINYYESDISDLAELFAQGEDGLWSDMCQNVIDQLRILFEENGVKQSLGRDVRLQIEETIHFLAAEGPIHPLLLKWHPKPKTICLPLNAAMMPYILKMEKYTENAEQATLANNRTATKRWRNKADKVMDAIIQILEA